MPKTVVLILTSIPVPVREKDKNPNPNPNPTAQRELMCLRRTRDHPSIHVKPT